MGGRFGLFIAFLRRVRVGRLVGSLAFAWRIRFCGGCSRVGMLAVQLGGFEGLSAEGCFDDFLLL